MKKITFYATSVAFLFVCVAMMDAQGVMKGRGHRDWEYDSNADQAPTFDANGHVKKFKGYAAHASKPGETSSSNSLDNNRATKAPARSAQVDEAFAQAANRSRANGAVSPTSNRYVAPRPVTFSSQTGLAQTSYERKRVDPSPKTDIVYADNGLVKGKVTLGVGDNRVAGSRANAGQGVASKGKTKPANTTTIDSPRF
jgi:hypothetical protein